MISKATLIMNQMMGIDVNDKVSHIKKVFNLPCECEYIDDILIYKNEYSNSKL